MYQKRKYCFLIFIFLFFAGEMVFLFSEDEMFQPDLDSIFEKPPEDIVIEIPHDIDYRSQFEKSDKFIVKGNFLMRGGLGVGWENKIGEEDLQNFLGAYSKATLSFDARPDSYIRIFGRFKTEIDQDTESDSWSLLSADELFCDYNLLDKIFFRVGKYYMTWGQGRLFTPGNFTDDCDEGTSVRMTFPNFLDGVTAVGIYDRKNYNRDEKRIMKEDLILAALADKTFGRVNFSAGMRYREGEGGKILGSLKTVLFGTDFFSDNILNYRDGDYSYEALAGFFREWERSKVYGEYYYDGSVKGDEDHCLGIAAVFKDIFGSPVDLGLKWLHSVYSESGQFISGLTISPWKHVDIRLAVPWEYGNKMLDEDFYDEFPIKSKLAFVLLVELSSGF